MFPVFPLAVFKSAKEKKKWLPKKCLVILWLIIFLSFTNFNYRTNIKTALRLRQHTDFIEISSEYIMQKKDSSYRGCFAFIHKPCLKSDKREEIVNLMKVQKEEFYSKLFPILQESFSSLHLLTETNKQQILEEIVNEIQGSISKPVPKKLCPFCRKLVQCSDGEKFESHLHSSQCLPEIGVTCNFKSFSGFICQLTTSEHVIVHSQVQELGYKAPVASQFSLPVNFALGNKSVIISNNYKNIIAAFCSDYPQYNIRAIICQCNQAIICTCTKHWRKLLNPCFKGTSAEFRSSFQSEKPFILINISFNFKANLSAFLSDIRPIKQCTRVVVFSRPEPDNNLDWVFRIKQQTDFKRLKVSFDIPHICDSHKT